MPESSPPLMKCGVTAVGSGLGFEIPKILGFEEWQCGIISFVIIW